MVLEVVWSFWDDAFRGIGEQVCDVFAALLATVDCAATVGDASRKQLLLQDLLSHVLALDWGRKVSCDASESSYSNFDLPPGEDPVACPTYSCCGCGGGIFSSSCDH